VLHRLDDWLFRAVNVFARDTGWLHPVVVGYARYGVVLFGALLVVGVLVARHSDARTLAAAGWAPLATLIAVAVNQPLGHLFHEGRPYAAHPHALVLVARSTDYSFPSDHAVMAGAVATGLLLVSRRLGTVAAVCALLMAFARVYVGAHYPWDVAAGLLVGAAVAVLSWSIVRIPLEPFTGWLRQRPGLRVGFEPASQEPRREVEVGLHQD
jgi:membrane-associated phospholipid phosphatase